MCPTPKPNSNSSSNSKMMREASVASSVDDGELTASILQDYGEMSQTYVNKLVLHRDLSRHVNVVCFPPPPSEMRSRIAHR